MTTPPITVTIHGNLPTTADAVDNLAFLIVEAREGSLRVLSCGCDAPFCFCDADDDEPACADCVAAQSFPCTH